jgi:subtilase family serine protease
LSYVRTDKNGQIRAHLLGPMTGHSPADLASAYNIDTNADPHLTIAVVAAFGYTNLESDLASYRSMFNLPECSKANGCLSEVNQDGNASPLPGPPPAMDDWTAETALDVDMISAGCPHCKILVVHANNDMDDGLFQAQATAARLGATVINNSWGADEDAMMLVATQFEHFFDMPGVGIFAASGDKGFNDGGKAPTYPATSNHVTAVGGTTLTKDSSARGWSEVAWSTFFGLLGATGSSCSLTIPKPAWQDDSACQFRASADVSAIGDALNGVTVFNQGLGGFVPVGGTSAASPLVAAIFASSGHALEPSSFAYMHKSAFNDVTSGSNGSCGNILCNAQADWDGPTGIGTPNAAALAQIPPTTATH